MENTTSAEPVAARIIIDRTKSAAVVFAIVTTPANPDGVVLAVEPDGSAFIGWSGNDAFNIGGEAVFCDVLAAVAIAHRRALSGRRGVLV